MIAGRYDSYIREVRRSGQGLGPPLLPPLQLGDERQLVPLVGGRQRQQGRRIRRRLAPRPRHLHPGRRHQRDLGLVPQRRPGKPDAEPQLASTRATTTSTGPASTATTGAPTRPARTAGAASTSSTAPPTKDHRHDRPLQADDDRRGRLDRVRRLQGGLDQGHAGQDPDQYPKIRGLLWFEKFDDGMDWPIETSASATSAFAEGMQNPAYAGNTLRLAGRPARSAEPAEPRPRCQAGSNKRPDDLAAEPRPRRRWHEHAHRPPPSRRSPADRHRHPRRSPRLPGDAAPGLPTRPASRRRAGLASGPHPRRAPPASARRARPAARPGRQRRRPLRRRAPPAPALQPRRQAAAPPPPARSTGAPGSATS